MIIKSTIFASAFSILLFGIPNNALANQTKQQQTQNQSDIAALFHQAAAKHKKELNDLWTRRGAPSISLPYSQVSYQDVAKVLSENTQSNPFVDNEAIYTMGIIRFVRYSEMNAGLSQVEKKDKSTRKGTAEFPQVSQNTE